MQINKEINKVNKEKYGLTNAQRSFVNYFFQQPYLDINLNAEFLDIGCGSGYIVIEAARKGCHFIGIDFSRKSVKQASSFAKESLTAKVYSLYDFIVCSAIDLPFKNEVFLKVSSICCLEHIPNNKKVVHKISRITKLKGKICICVPNSNRRTLPLWFPRKLFDKHFGDLHHYKAENIINEFTKHGFLLKEIIYRGHFCQNSRTSII